jgi:hypothetical protein
MKIVLVVFIAAGLLLVPFSAATYAQRPSPGSRPPVAPPLVREGEFAVQLAQSLSLTPSNEEPESEYALASLGIAPRNGWISDYPVTPDIIAEVQSAAAEAAESGNLPMTRENAVDAVRKVCSDAGLLISTTGGQNDRGAAISPAENPSVVEDYYYDSGPPVVTYYPPPWDYGYLYSWVPYPFWWGPCWYGGFFILSDFNLIFFDRHHHHHHCVSNHVADGTGRVARVDPVRRFTGGIGAGTVQSRLAGVRGADAQQSGRSIMNRDIARYQRSSSSAVPADSGMNRSRIPPPTARNSAVNRSVPENRIVPPPRPGNTNRAAAMSASRPFVEYPRAFAPKAAPHPFAPSGDRQGGYYGAAPGGGYNGRSGGAATGGGGMPSGGGGFHR